MSNIHYKNNDVVIFLCTLYIAAPTEKCILKAWDFCKEKSRSIEVVYRDEDLEEEVLTRVHFNVNIEVYLVHETCYLPVQANCVLSCL